MGLGDDNLVSRPSLVLKGLRFQVFTIYEKIEFDVKVTVNDKFVLDIGYLLDDGCRMACLSSTFLLVPNS